MVERFGDAGDERDARIGAGHYLPRDGRVDRRAACSAGALAIGEVDQRDILGLKRSAVVELQLGFDPVLRGEANLFDEEAKVLHRRRNLGRPLVRVRLAALEILVADLRLEADRDSLRGAATVTGRA